MPSVPSLAGLVIVGLAFRHIRNAPMPFSHGRPLLLVSVALLFLAAFLLKAIGWARLFHAPERPGPVSLAAAGGGATLMGIVLPGRFDELVRIAIVRRFPGCPAGVRAICLSLVTLGMIDAAALAPFSIVAAAWPGNSVAVRIGFAVVGAGGIAAAAIVAALPHVTRSERLMRFRITRWLAPRATPLRGATEAWALVSASWLVRATALTLLLAALGLGFNFPLAMMFLCAGAAAAALPIALGRRGDPGRRGRNPPHRLGNRHHRGTGICPRRADACSSSPARPCSSSPWRGSTTRWLVGISAPHFAALPPRV